MREVLGEGGRGAHRWRGGARHRRTHHSLAGRHGVEEIGARGWAAWGRSVERVGWARGVGRLGCAQGSVGLLDR
jgi:hypothetical protein